jgi:hypothetical protein
VTDEEIEASMLELVRPGYECEGCAKQRDKWSRFCPICGCLENRFRKPIVDDSPLPTRDDPDDGNGLVIRVILLVITPIIGPINRVLKRLLCADTCNKCGRPFLENYTTRLKPNNVLPTRCYMPSCRHIYLGRDIYFSITGLAFFFGVIFAGSVCIMIGNAILIAAGIALYEFINLFQ